LVSFQSSSKDPVNRSTKLRYKVLNDIKAFMTVKQTERNIPTTELYMANVILPRKFSKVACAATMFPGSIDFKAGRPLLIPKKVPKIPPMINKLGNLENMLFDNPIGIRPHSLLKYWFELKIYFTIFLKSGALPLS